MGEAYSRGRWRDYGFPLGVALGVLGETYKGRNDIDADDGSSYDAPSALYQQSADFGVNGTIYY